MGRHGSAIRPGSARIRFRLKPPSGGQTVSKCQGDRLLRVSRLSSRKSCGSIGGISQADGTAVCQSGHGRSSCLTLCVTSSCTSLVPPTWRPTFVRRLGGESNVLNRRLIVGPAFRCHWVVDRSGLSFFRHDVLLFAISVVEKK